MRYALCVLLPPLGLIGSGAGCGAFSLVCLLTVCGYFPGVIAALVTVASSGAQKRHNELMAAMKTQQ